MSAPTHTPLILLSQLQAELSTGSASDTTAQARYRRLIVQASERLTTWCKRRFDVHIDTRYYTVRGVDKGGDIDGISLVLDADLRSITTLTNGDSTTITSDKYQLMPLNQDAKQEIRLNLNAGIQWQPGTDATGAVSVEGKWGFGGQWLDTGTTVNADIVSTSATTFTSSSGASLEVGMVLKIDSEYLYVDSISSNEITVGRGFNGSTAATHTTGAVVYRWEADALAQQLVSFLVLWHIERVKGRLSGEAVLGDAGLPLVTAAVPQEVRDGVQYLTRRRNLFGAV